MGFARSGVAPVIYQESLNWVLREIKQGLTGQDSAASVKELGDKPAFTSD